MEIQPELAEEYRRNILAVNGLSVAIRALEMEREEYMKNVRRIMFQAIRDGYADTFPDES